MAGRGAEPGLLLHQRQRLLGCLLTPYREAAENLPHNRRRGRNPEVEVVGEQPDRIWL
jgi:hypothetical protein